MTVPILVPLDGSALGEQALLPAVSLARRSGSTLHVVRVHVLNIPVGFPEAAVFFSSELENRARDAEREYLKAVTRRTREVPVETALLEGSIASALEKYIANRNIGLVVMTTHGRSGLSRAWLGSIADAMIRKARVPVLLQRPDMNRPEPAGDGYSHILIPLDGSETAESIVPHATRIGALADARYTLVQVLPPADERINAEAVASVIFPPESLQKIEEESIAYLERVARRMRADGFAVEATVAKHPQPAIGILNKAEEVQADMIAIATHGRTGLRRAALGSVADKVVRSTHLPVLVYRPANKARARQRSVT